MGLDGLSTYVPPSEKHDPKLNNHCKVDRCSTSGGEPENRIQCSHENGCWRSHGGVRYQAVVVLSCRPWYSDWRSVTNQSCYLPKLIAHNVVFLYFHAN